MQLGEAEGVARLGIHAFDLITAYFEECNEMQHHILQSHKTINNIYSTHCTLYLSDLVTMYPGSLAGLDNLISTRAQARHGDLRLIGIGRIRGGSKLLRSKLPSFDHHSNGFTFNAHIWVALIVL